MTFTEAGRTKTLTLAAEEVREVAAALARYEAAKAELDEQATAGLRRLHSRRLANGRRLGGPR